MIPENKIADEAYHLANIISPDLRKRHGWNIRDWKIQIEKYEFEGMMIRKYIDRSFYQHCRAMTKEQLNVRCAIIEEILVCYRKELEEWECIVARDYEAWEYFKQNPQKPFVGVNLQEVTLIQTTLF